MQGGAGKASEKGAWGESDGEGGQLYKEGLEGEGEKRDRTAETLTQ